MPDKRLKRVAVYQLINIKTGEESSYFTATYASKYVLGSGRNKQKFERSNESVLYAVDASSQPAYVRPMSECPELIEDAIDFGSSWKLIGGISLRDARTERDKRIDALVSRELLK